MKQIIKTKVLAALLTIVAVAMGQTAWAADTYSVRGELNGSTKYKFIVERSGNTGVAETVKYRTVSLSAIEGKHFTAVSGELTFPADITSMEVEVDELTPSGDNLVHYMCQDGTTRKYRFEVLDLNGFLLAYKDRSRTIGTKVTSPYETKTVTFFTNELSTPFTDDGYDNTTHNGPKTVAASQYFSQAAPQAYFKKVGAELRMTLNFDAREGKDGYQYIQILFNETTDCDNRNKCDNGDPGNISLSSYMAGFCHKAGSTLSTYASYSFPVLSQENYYNYSTPLTNVWNTSECGYNTVGDLRGQKFKSISNSRADDGRLIIPTSPNDFTTLVLRFNASGDNEDDWYAKNVVAKIQAVENTAPTIIGYDDYVVSAGPYNVGNTFYVSIPFSEIVVVDDSDMPTLQTYRWGNLTYFAGSGSNVLTFKGTIPYTEDALQITGLSGTVEDLSGNKFSFTQSNKITYSDKTANKTFTLAGFESLGENIYGIADKHDLYALANLVNCARNNCDGLTFRQTKDITCDGSYSPIGTSDSPFIGTYDGNGKTISGIRVDSADGLYIGLFGYLGTFDEVHGSSATVHHATIENVVLSDCVFRGKSYVGGIAGRSLQAIYHNCRVNNDVYIRAGKDNAQYFGGIAGYAYGVYSRITGCLSAAKVLSNGNSGCKYFGGLVGSAGNGHITNCFYAGSSSDITADSNVGAIIGYRDGTYFKNTYHTASGLGAVDGADVIPSGDNIDYRDGASYGYTISSAEDAVSVEVAVVAINNLQGEVLNYDVSGLTAYHTYYNTAMLYNNTLYCGANQNVNLTLGYAGEVPAGYYCSYTVKNANNEDITATALNGSKLTMPASNVTIGHTFIGNPYTVSFNKNAADATGEMDSQAFVYGEEQKLTANVFERPGYDFAGWSLTPTGEKAYDDTENVSNLTIESGVTVTLYAKWTATAWAGLGTKESPYRIEYPSQLDLLASNVNSSVNNYNGIYFLQTADLTYNGTENNYTPVGCDNDHEFQGIYNGGGNTISGININRTDDDFLGVFGHVYQGSVENVTLANSTIIGREKVGGIVGMFQDPNATTNYYISNCRVESTVTIGSGTASSKYHGGIAGMVYAGVISGCYTAATITNSEKSDCEFYGGIVGISLNNTTIKDCLYSGSTVTAKWYYGAIIGGKASESTPTITNNYYTADGMTGGMGNNTSSGSDVEGARLARSITKGPGLVIQGGAETAYSNSGITAIGTAMLQYDGTLYSGEGQTLTISHVDREGYTYGGYIVKDASDADITATVLSGTTLTVPASDIIVSCIWNTIPWAGEGTKESPYLIQYPSQLDLLASNVNSGVSKYKDTYFKQTATLTYDGTENNYIPIGNTDYYFEGHYNGDGKTISGINVNLPTTYYIGLFGGISVGSVENVVLSNSTFKGYDYVGGIVSKTYDATVSNCRVENTVVSGRYHAGGITGYLYVGTVSNCSVKSTEISCEQEDGGGIVGDIYIRGTISNCRVESTAIDGRANVGGIVGYNYDTVIGCFSDATIGKNGQSYYRCGGIVGGNSNSSTVKDCLYIGTTIAANSEKGAIIGYGYSDNNITNNYYTAIDLGGMYGSDHDGARRGYSITLGEGVGISGENTEYNVSGLTAIASNALEYNGVIYSGATQQVTLSHNDYDGHTFSGYTSEDVEIDNNGTFEMPAKKVLVLGSWSPQIPVTIKMNSFGIMTYASPYALDFSGISDLTAYYASAFTSNHDDTGTLTLTAATQVPAGEGLLLKGTKNATYSVPVIASTEVNPTNLLVGLTTPTVVSKTVDSGSDECTTFILANGSHGINWYVLAEDSYTLKANSAFLSLKSSDVYTNSGNARQIVMDFDGSEIAAIKELVNSKSSNSTSYYTVDGVKLNGKPTRKGLYIVNGTKVAIK